MDGCDAGLGFYGALADSRDPGERVEQAPGVRGFEIGEQVVRIDLEVGAQGGE